MSEVATKRRGRGKGKRPAMMHVNIRVPTDVMDFFKQQHNYTKAMRDVLIGYVQRARPDDSDPPPPHTRSLPLP